MANKTLYFEGAGWFDADISKATDMKNCRVRTAFTNDEGKKIYLEITACEVTKHSSSTIKHLKNAGFIDSCFYIMGDDDENKHSIRRRNETAFEYNRANVLAFVNSLGCSFDTVETLPDLAGYRVFKDKWANGADYYNYGDEFQYDAELTAKRENIYHHFYELEKSEGKQYPNFSLWVDGKDKSILHLLRHFNGHNGNWEIRTDTENWEASMVETAQPRLQPPSGSRLARFQKSN